jgi:hypothetical protein
VEVALVGEPCVRGGLRGPCAAFDQATGKLDSQGDPIDVWWEPDVGFETPDEGIPAHPGERGEFVETGRAGDVVVEPLERWADAWCVAGTPAARPPRRCFMSDAGDELGEHPFQQEVRGAALRDAVQTAEAPGELGIVEDGFVEFEVDPVVVVEIGPKPGELDDDEAGAPATAVDGRTLVARARVEHDRSPAPTRWVVLRLRSRKPPRSATPMMYSPSGSTR